MGLLSGLKAQKAYRAQQKGDKEEAIRLYEEAFAEGVNDPRYNLAYALLIIRDGQYQKAKDFLVTHQKTPGMSQEQRTTLLVDCAACCFRLGSIDKGIHVLEEQYRKTQTGLLYQTLGYLYVEKYDQANRPDFAAMKEGAASAAENTEGAAADETGGGNATEASAVPEAGWTAAYAADGENGPSSGRAAEAEKQHLSPEEAWNSGVKKAEAFLREALDYDDEDPICLDNMGQFIYRVQGDPEGAREWFEKALKLKDTQIDTLYFLSRYDEASGDRQAALEKLEKAAGGRFSPLNYCQKETVEREIARLKGEN